MPLRSASGLKMPMTVISRRLFLQACGALAAASHPAVHGDSMSAAKRRFHWSVSPDALEADPSLLRIAADAGVDTVWITGFMYGYWHYPPETIQRWRAEAEKAGLAAQVINVPLGHPGDSLGAKSGDVPLTPPEHWRMGMRPDGSTFAGTSLHAPAVEENAAALGQLRDMGARQVFVDDDYRLAQGPGVIGGCFCEEHQRRFLEAGGYSSSQWGVLLDSVQRRELTPILSAWVEFTCDELTAAFRAQQAAVPDIELGSMIMYLGAEKAGIRLNDYRDVLFRVGELMFNDASFAPVKGKTNELFSALFHRRFAQPDKAYSETTAFPADQLSAANMAAKLVVSTIADVRHTMYMSGLTPFPKEHWPVLAEAMKKQAHFHETLAGHTPRGPFKHFWGEHGRRISDDNPYSSYLALGVPFEVTDKLSGEGVTFLADADAKGQIGKGPVQRKCLVVRPEAGISVEHARVVPESLPDLFALKRELLPTLQDVPVILDEKPVVCAWYPEARAALVWNLSEQRETLTLRMGEKTISLELDALDSRVIGDLG